MIKNFITYLSYRRKLRLLKIILVNHIMHIVVNNNDFIVGFERLLSTLATNENTTEYMKIVNDYFQTIKSTTNVNNAINNKK